MAVNKKIPMRKCVGCGEMKPKKELIRILRTEVFWYQLHTYFRYLFSELYTPDSVSVTLPDSHTILHNLVSCFHFSVAVLCTAASYSVGIAFTNTVTTMLLLFLLHCCQSAPYHNACNSILQTPNRNQLRI